MCTAIAFCKDSFFFGRTLDVAEDFTPAPIFLPRKAPLRLSQGKLVKNHFSVLGMGESLNEIPLFYDGFNEYGLAGAALNFPGCAHYLPHSSGAIASYEVLSYTLAVCKNLWQVRAILENGKISSLPVSKETLATPLHWIFADKSGALVIEQTEKGLSVYDSFCEVLTNSPDLPSQERLFLSKGLCLSPKNPKSDADGENYISQGKGTDGLFGGFSSKERFVRAAYMRRYCKCDSSDDFFRIADTVSIPRGAVINSEGKYHYTRYTSCVDGENKTYLYHKSGDRQLCTLSLTDAFSDGDTLTEINTVK